MEYLLAAKARCDFLWIGVTQFRSGDLKTVGGAGTHRATAPSNPLTYHEREVILVEAFLDAGIDRDDFDVCPFPVETPDALNEFLPTTVPVLTTVCEEWNRVKINILEGAGYSVEVLWERNHKAVTGQKVRGLIAARDSRYVGLVPPATVRAIDELRLWERLPRPEN